VKRNDELTVVLESFAFEGKSVARVEGLVVFVTGGVPGDTVRVRIRKAKSTFAEGDVLEILAHSSLRDEPRCRYFGVCGGCRWQNVRYDAQLAFKRQHVIDALERIGGFRAITVRATLGAEDAYFYRNKMEFSFGPPWLSREEMTRRAATGAPETDPVALGLHVPGRFDRVLDTEECFLQSPASVRIVNAVRRFAHEHRLDAYSTVTHTGYLRNLVIREGKRTGERMVNLVTLDERPALMQAFTRALLAAEPEITTVINNITDRKSQVAIGDRETVLHGPGVITERIGSRTYRISANSFFQTNTLQAERLYDTVKDFAALTGAETVYDLYSGTGTIALHLADRARSVVGVEAVAAAVEDAGSNARANGVTNCTFLLGDLKDRLLDANDWRARHGAPEVVVLDPPRAGMHEKVAREVAVMDAPRIVYVSCNPATQARDLRILGEVGGYTIEAVQPVDMFPHTFHIENVVALTKK
jgi:23S rRNA (uracil1939-C5)-methyltransferase